MWRVCPGVMLQTRTEDSHLGFDGDLFGAIWNKTSGLFLISLLFGGGFHEPFYLSYAFRAQGFMRWVFLKEQLYSWVGWQDF